MLCILIFAFTNTTCKKPEQVIPAQQVWPCDEELTFAYGPYRIISPQWLADTVGNRMARWGTFFRLTVSTFEYGEQVYARIYTDENLQSTPLGIRFFTCDGVEIFADSTLFIEIRRDPGAVFHTTIIHGGGLWGDLARYPQNSIQWYIHIPTW